MGSTKPRDVQMPPTAANGAKTALRRALEILDWLVLVAGALLLVWLVATAAQANISADAVDYYAILQRLTPSDETPIVRNLPFVDQRSPGYSLAALVPYLLISATVDPWVETDRLEGVGHFVQEEYGQEVVPIIAKFLRSPHAERAGAI